VQYYALLVFTMVAVSGLCNNLLKILFGRARPRQWHQEEEYGFYGWRIASDYGSFPSGHSATLGALVAIAVLLGGRWGWLALPLACSIASTRVVVGSHYPSDVLMGLWVGFALAYALGYRLHRLYYERFTTA
jgi:undecaprenyl-diphosphatase